MGLLALVLCLSACLTASCITEELATVNFKPSLSLFYREEVGVNWLVLWVPKSLDRVDKFSFCMLLFSRPWHFS